MNPAEALAWLHSMQQFGIKLGLDNPRALLALLGHPEREVRCLHVAGTNGKGSVCALLDAVLRAAGHRTGLYTSPHLVDFRERIQVDGRWIAPETVARLLTTVRNGTRDWPHAPTFFEIVTAIALRHFADAGCDYVVLETGMGGRLDATNAVTPIVSVLTPIGMDHMQWLGDTVEKIAAEKAGIIKPGVPVVSAPQVPAAAAVLTAHGPVEFVQSPIPADLTVALPGSHQRENAALALAALRAAGIPVSENAARAGLRNVRWPGRFQCLGDLVLDGAHNAHGAAQLVKTWWEVFGAARVPVIFGAMRDKDYAEMLRVLAPLATEFRFVPVDNPRAVSPEELAAAWAGPARVYPSLRAALDEVEGRTLVTGSLFLIGEALALLEG